MATPTKKDNMSNSKNDLMPDSKPVPMELIVADPRRNSRTVMDITKLHETMNSMKENGQLTPVLVERRPDGKYDLVFGYRRHAAALKLEWTHLRCEVREPMPALDRKLANIAENLAREDLTPPDQAMAFLDLKISNGLSGIAIGKKTGKSTQYVNNLIRIAEGLDEKVMERWVAEWQPKFGLDENGKKLPGAGALHVCTMDWLTKLVANVPKAEQEHELMKALGYIPDDEDSGDAGDDSSREPRPPGSPKRATMVQLGKALEAAEAIHKDRPTDENRGVIMALKFAIGRNRSIKGVITIGPTGGME